MSVRSLVVSQHCVGQRPWVYYQFGVSRSIERPGRTSADRSVGGDVFDNRRTGSDACTAADRNFTYDIDAWADVDVVADDGGVSARRTYCRELSETYIIAYDGTFVDDKTETVLYQQAVSDAYLRRYEYTITAIAMCHHLRKAIQHAFAILSQPEPERKAYAFTRESRQPYFEYAVSPAIMTV